MRSLSIPILNIILYCSTQFYAFVLEPDGGSSASEAVPHLARQSLPTQTTMLQKLLPELIPLILYNDAIELADLYFVRFACRSLRVAAASVLFKRVKWLATDEKDSCRLAFELRNVKDVLAARLGLAADAAWKTAGLEPLSPYSTGRLLLRAKVPPDFVVGSEIFRQIEPEHGGKLLKGWGARPKEIRLLLQVISRDNEYPLDDVPDPNANAHDGAELRYLDPLTVVIREAGLPPQDMLEAIPSPVYLEFGWYFRVVWELEALPERKDWTKKLALEQLPRVMRKIRSLAERFPEGRRDPHNFVADAFCNCSAAAIAAVLATFELPWNRLGQLACRARSEAASVCDVARTLFGPNGHAKTSQDCASFFAGITPDYIRQTLASALVEDAKWPLSMPFQLWDFLPPSNPREFDTRSSSDLWESIICGTAPAQSSRLESYMSKLVNAAPEEWTRRMKYAVLRHFDLAKPSAETYQPRYSTQKTQTARIRSVARAMGDVIDSVALVLIKKIIITNSVSNLDLVTLLDTACRQLVRREPAALKPEEALRLVGQLQTQTVPDVEVISTQRFRLIAVVSDRIESTWHQMREEGN